MLNESLVQAIFTPSTTINRLSAETNPNLNLYLENVSLVRTASSNSRRIQRSCRLLYAYASSIQR